MTVVVKQPTVWDVVFSLKTFAAAALALFIAFYCDLPNPYWAMAAVYIVAHPLSGALTSKAIYRLLGTAIGGMATVVMLPQLITSPELTTLGLAAWLGACLFVSLLDRSPRAYVFMLAGYTATLIAFPIVDTPENVFTYATNRAEEIGVGIICAALVGRLVFPRHAGPVLAGRIDAWLRDSADLALKSIRGQGNTSEALKSRQKLAIDAVDLRNFTTHVAYDTSSLRSTVHAMRILQSRMVALLPMVASCNDLIRLRDRLIAETYQGNSNSDKLDHLINVTAEWLETQTAMDENDLTKMRTLRDAILEDMSQSKRWIDLISRNLTVRLTDIIQIYSDCLNLRQDIVDGTRHKLRWHRFDFLGDVQPIHYDYGMAFLSAFAAMLAVLISVTFWRLSEWPQGGTAAMMTGIFCCLFATQDDPVPMIRSFIKQLLLVLLIAFVFQFALFPLVDGYIPLMLALALVLIPAGILMTIPSRFMMGMAITVNLPNLLLLQSRLNDDFYTFINANTAMILGIIIAAATTGIVRSVGAEWSASRLVRSGWSDIVQVAEKQNNVKAHSRLLHRMLDRFGLVAPRLAAIPADSHIGGADILKDVRVGLNTIELQHLRDTLGPTSRKQVDVALQQLALYYRSKLRHFHDPDGTALLQSLDAALNRLVHTRNNDNHQRISFALTGLRQNLFAQAQPFIAVSPTKSRGQDA